MTIVFCQSTLEISSVTDVAGAFGSALDKVDVVHAAHCSKKSTSVYVAEVT